MNRKEVIEDIRKRFDCSEREARKILVFGLTKGHIKKQVNWNVLISYFILGAVILTAIWAFIKVTWA